MGKGRKKTRKRRKWKNERRNETIKKEGEERKQSK